MQTHKHPNLFKIPFLAVIALLIVTSLPSCSRKISFLSSAEVPAATGKVKIKKDGNNNYNIGINIEHLAPSNKLQPPANTYIVWVVTGNNETKNMGQINSSSSFLSSKLKASFSTVSPVKPTKVFITAEDNANAFYPGNRVILTTDNF